MERIAKAWDGIAADPLQAAAATLAVFFVIASTAIGLMFVWDEARTMPLILSGALLLIVLAAELYKSLFIVVTFRSGRFWAGLLGLPIMIAACFYSITANNKTMERYFGKHEWRTVAESRPYQMARAEAADIEAKLRELPASRVTGVIKAELDGLLAIRGLGDCRQMSTRLQYRQCPKVTRLRAELAGAQARDRLESDLARAKTKLASFNEPEAQGHAGPAGRILADLGVTVTSFSELIGMVLAFLVEGGSLLAPPVLIGGSRAPRGRLSFGAPAAVPAPAPLAPMLPRDYGDERVTLVARFFEERCETWAGSYLSAMKAWHEFENWRLENKAKDIVKQNNFWKIASEKLRFQKEKASSADGSGMHYKNLRLKPRSHSLGTLIPLRRGHAAARA